MPAANWPASVRQSYAELRPVLALVRVMRRFLEEVIEPDPELNPFYTRLDSAYTELLQRELAPHAFDMASMLIDLEDATQ
jgi:hypothetical protein